MSTQTPPPPRHPRRRLKRKITLGLAMLLTGLALLVGLVVGYATRGDTASQTLITQTRSVPVVTVTVPAP